MAKPAPKKAKAKPAPKKAPAKPKAKTKTKTKTKPKPEPAKAGKAKSVAQPRARKVSPPVTPRRRTARPIAVASTPRAGGRVVEILDDEQPTEALRRYLEGLPPGPITIQDAQVALGAAQLVLLPITREHRGGADVHALLDLVLGAWDRFGDRDGFHAQEFLRNAFAAVGNDPQRIDALAARVPSGPSPELLFNIASAYAVAGDKPTMLLAVHAALASGVSVGQVRRDPDFAAYATDDDLLDLLEGARAPEIPLDTAPYVPGVRRALAMLRTTLEHFGEPIVIHPPADLRDVLAVERAARIQLPNDYRALLTLADGCTLFDRTFFSLADFRADAPLAMRAREYLEASARYGAAGIDACVPLANWGQPNDWLLYDPHGIVRRGEPGYVLMVNADEQPVEDLESALAQITEQARDILATN